MSSSDFRHIAFRTDPGKSERLFRAAVSAFCSLTRPSRREIAQLEDLTLPLFDAVSADSRRFVAAALSECHPAPAALVRRLCDEPVDICAPLLLRSEALSDVDLIGLIGRHGLPHARAIGRRQDLNQTIVKLIAALEATASSEEPISITPLQETHDMPSFNLPRATDDKAAAPGEAAENVRRRLRSMMLPTHQDAGARNVSFLPQNVEGKLRETALTGNLAFFQTALADALEIDFRIARSITEASGYAALLAALRALDISEDRAFVIAAAIRPEQFAYPEAIRLFLDRYRLLHREAALDALRGWKAETLSLAVKRSAQTAQQRPATPVQASAAQNNARRLRAS